MAKIENALIPFVLIIMGINAMFMFLTYLPNSTDGSSTYNFGLPVSKQDEITNYYSDLEEDMNSLSESSAGVVGSTSERTDIDILGKILGGLGLVATAPSLILNLVTFVVMILFGFLFWIDYFFAPIIAGFGGFVWIAWILKGVFLMVQLFGLISLFMMIYSGFRKG